jgi:hypothetical protein
MKDREMILSDLLRARRVRFDAGYGLENVNGHNRPHSASESRRPNPEPLPIRPEAPAVSGFGQTGNPYDELGVRTVINCEGTMTMLGSSILWPELEAVWL